MMIDDDRAPTSASRRRLLVGIAATAFLAACSDGAGRDPFPTPTPTPSPTPSPTPTPTGFIGAVYALTNAVAGNAVAGFGRNMDGTLAAIDIYPTGGIGGVFDGANDGLDPLIAEDALVAVDNRFLLGVNPGSNSIFSLAINPDFSLTLIGTNRSGGVGPNSIAYHDGLVYVANADRDGAPADPAAQSGTISGFRLDAATGRLTRIAGSTRILTNRPSDIEFSPDGKYLIVSSWNAGSAALPSSDGDDELVVYAVNADGTLSDRPTSKAASTLPGNAALRNLPAAIGIEIIERGDRTIVIATEAREFLSTGAPAMLPMFQTASVSTWELQADGALSPRSLDVLTGPSLTTGPASPSSACWVAVSPARTNFWVTHASGAVISSFRLNADGTIVLLDTRAAVLAAADAAAVDPLAAADGPIDLVVSSDGRHLYQLLGLRGTINVYRIGASASLSLTQQATGGLPMNNIVGLVSVDAAQ